ncbi:Sec8 exocyst complex component-specific domain-domain-containing protein [Catenaria anguillulae PL171]|uniref:Exocyst complex component Sec8 n=1 Tax=Catenaria anguillulae PL171 TaxID=765915 RepID=A0A1Y2HFY5_9FUNG|nr:Sec8 exocyst complex component-specific domain-domain-containing protein [Catenaria anguillulae PL171]
MYNSPSRPDRLPPKSSSRSRERIDQFRELMGPSPPGPPPPLPSGPMPSINLPHGGGGSNSSMSGPPLTPGGSQFSRARSASTAAAARDAALALSRAESVGATIPLHRDVEDVLNEVRISWPFMQQEDFQEVQLALDLLDGPGGRSVRSFNEFMARLEPAIDIVVNDYHSSFAFSVQHFSETLEGLQELQSAVQGMKTKLLQSRDHLQLKQFDLLGLWNKNLVFKEMLRIMDTVDKMRRAPAEIESFMAGKYYISAVIVLNDALKTIHGKECERIGALEETRKQLTSLREAIFEAIVSDINAHIYLKSPYCEDRWLTFLGSSAAGGDTPHATSRAPAASLQPPPSARGPCRRSVAHGRKESLGGSAALDSPLSATPLGSTGLGLGDADEDGGDDFGFAREPGAEENPEADSLGFITLCLEALTRLGMLAPGLAEIRQRMNKELFVMIEKCITEANEAYVASQYAPPAAAASSPSGRGGGGLVFAIADKHLLRDVRAKEARFEALRKLVTTVFAKLDAVMEGHKLTCNMVDAMSRRPNFATFGNAGGDQWEPVYSVEDVAFVVHEELQSILMDYLRPKGSTSEVLLSDMFKPQPPPKPATQFPDGSFPPASLFKFGQSSAFSSVSKFYTSHMPPPPPPAAATANGSQVQQPQESHVIDRYASSKTMNHTTMFDADLEFICVVYRPTCDFLARLVRLSGNRAANAAFLDDYVLSMYIPSMENKVQGHVSKYVNGPDGFVVGEDNLLQSATCLFSLIQSMCATVWQVPFRSDEYLRMIEDILVRYVERCFAKYRMCVTTTPPNGTMDDPTAADGGEDASMAGHGECVSGAWARNPDLLQIVCQNTHFRGEALNAEMNERYNVQEILMQARLCNDRSFQRHELIFDKKKLELLAYLRSSLKWFRDQIIKLMETNVDDALLTTGSLSNSLVDLHASHTDLATTTGAGGSLSNVASAAINLTRPTRTIGSPDGGSGDADDSSSSLRMLTVPRSHGARFREILDAYQALADSCAVTLHLEVRVHAMYHADLAMREGTYFVEGAGASTGAGTRSSSWSLAGGDDPAADVAIEPEPYVLQLNADLGVMEELCLRILPMSDAMFVFDGVGLLLTHYLVANVRYLRRLNHAGVRKMVTSIRALHQHLLHADLCRDVRLDHARRYYELYFMGAERMLDDIADHGARYTLDEYRNMLDFMCDVSTLGDRLASESKAVSMAAAKTQKEYREWRRRLEELMTQQ